MYSLPFGSPHRSPEAGPSKRRKIDASSTASTARESSKPNLGKVPSLFDVAKRRLLEAPTQAYLSLKERKVKVKVKEEVRDEVTGEVKTEVKIEVKVQRYLSFEKGELAGLNKFFRERGKPQYTELEKEWEWARKHKGLASIPEDKMEACARQAAEKGFDFSVDYLLSRGVNPGTPFISAAKGGHLAIVERIHPGLGREGEAEAFKKAAGFGKGQVVDHFLKTWEGNPPSGKVFHEAFVSAVEKGHEDIVIKLEPHLSGEFRGDAWNKAAGVAAGKGHLEVVKMLCEVRERDLDPAYSIASMKLTCIQEAMEKEKLDIVEFVAGSAPSWYRKQYCALAAYHGNLPGVELIFGLITEENWQREALRDACREAARKEQHHVIDYLQTVGLSEADRGAACITAAANGKTAAVKKLLELGISRQDSAHAEWEARTRYPRIVEEVRNFRQQGQNRSRNDAEVPNHSFDFTAS